MFIFLWQPLLRVVIVGLLILQQALEFSYKMIYSPAELWKAGVGTYFGDQFLRSH